MESDFTPAEWQIIVDALRKRAEQLQWKAGAPGLPAGRAEVMETAAQRRFALARRCVGARIQAEQDRAV